MTTEAFLGIDVGGTGAKAGVVDWQGVLRGFGRRGYAPQVSAEGHAEVPIETIYAAARDAAAQAVSEAGVRPAAAAVASQGQTFVSLDAADQPLHPAILWYDTRAAAQAERMRSEAGSQAGTGPLPLIQTISTAPKILWLRDRLPERMQSARRHLLLPDYFAYRLTGRAVTDFNTASSTGLYADAAADYDPRALAAAAIPRGSLAAIQAPGTVVGPILPAAAAEWQLAPGAVLVAGTNDQYAGAIAAGNCRPGVLSETTGTCLALVTLAERVPEALPAGLLTGRFPVAGLRFVLAYAKTAGLLVDWFRREFCPDVALADLDRLAAGIPEGADGLTVLPHLDGRVSPLPDPALRGAFANLTLRHTRAHLHRAILESLTFCLREYTELLRRHGLTFPAIRSLGGGAQSDFWLQMKADVTGLPVEKPRVTEGAVMGAAMLAATGCGVFASLAESSRALYHPARVFHPRPEARTAYDAAYLRYLDAARRLSPASG
jgi:xylulokinase